MQTVPIDNVKIGDRKRRRLDQAKVAQLVDSIGEVGLLNPITIREDGYLVAGRHRLEACRNLGYLHIQATVLDGSSLHAELAEIDENLVRNDLTVLEQGEHIRRRDEILAELGLRADVGGQPGNTNAAKNERDNLTPSFRTTSDIAAEIGLSERTAQRRKQAAEAIPEPVRDAIRDTPTADNQSDLLKLGRMPEPDQHAVAEKIASGEAKDVQSAHTAVRRERRQSDLRVAASTVCLPDSVTTIHGDFREAMADLPDSSVALVFADPPYDEASIPLYADMAFHAARVLVDGGSLMCYAGHYALGEIITSMSEHLRFWWTCGIKHSGPSARLQGKCVFVEWKPILWFVKGGRRDHTYVADMVARSTVPTKAEHEWQQGIEEASYYIQQLTAPGEIVIDPFMGSGTTVIAAATAGRLAWGCEIDADRYAVAQGRIAEALS